MRAILCLTLALVAAWAPTAAATTTLTMSVDPAASSADTTLSVRSAVSGAPQPALSVLTIALPDGFAYRGDRIASSTCRAEDLQGPVPQCPETSLLGSGTALVAFVAGNVSGTAKVDPIRMYNAGPDNVLFFMRALAPLNRSVVVPSTVKVSEPDFGPVFRIGPASGASIGRLALTEFSFTSKPGVFRTAPCTTGTWLAAGRYLFLGGAAQELNPRIACTQAATPTASTGQASGTASAATPAAALTVAGTRVGTSRRGAGRVKVLSTGLRASGGTVAVRLQCASAARCLGTLRITDRRRPGGIARFGADRFSIAGRTTKTITISLRTGWSSALSRVRGAVFVRAHVDGQSRTTDSVRSVRLAR